MSLLCKAGGNPPHDTVRQGKVVVALCSRKVHSIHARQFLSLSSRSADPFDSGDNTNNNKKKRRIKRERRNEANRYDRSEEDSHITQCSFPTRPFPKKPHMPSNRSMTTRLRFRITVWFFKCISLPHVGFFHWSSHNTTKLTCHSVGRYVATLRTCDGDKLQRDPQQAVWPLSPLVLRGGTGAMELELSGAWSDDGSLCDILFSPILIAL